MYLGTYSDEGQAALQYELAQLYLHGCDVSACKHKLNFSQKWSSYSRDQLRAETGDVGACIEDKRLEQFCRAAVVHKGPGRRKPLHQVGAGNQWLQEHQQQGEEQQQQGEEQQHQQQQGEEQQHQQKQQGEEQQGEEQQHQ